MNEKSDVITAELSRDYIEELARDFNAIYDTFYKNGYNSELVTIGDKMLKAVHPAATLLIIARHDIITSDREAATLAKLAQKRGWL